MDKPKAEDFALAYTVKTSDATTPEQFLSDYEKNLKLFNEEFAKHKGRWLF